MPDLTPEQRRNIRKALAEAKRHGASPREQKALVEAMGVESNYRHLPYGDRDSVGVLQQRPSQRWGPAGESVETDVSQFLERARAANTQGGSAGALAQRVQRSAFPDRYQARSGEADTILASYGRGSDSATPARRIKSTRTVTTPGVDRSMERRAAVGQFLGQGGVANSQAVLTLAGTYGQLADTPGTSKTTTKKVRQPKVTLDRKTATLKERADTLNADRRPYLWGGGHGGESWGLDCSGAVSQVLGVNPRVSGEFESWGRAGKGKRVTIYANSKHVLMEIGGRFFGTSKTNPGGGPGWIPREHIPESYLKQFTARHPPGQ